MTFDIAGAKRRQCRDSTVSVVQPPPALLPTVKVHGKLKVYGFFCFSPPQITPTMENPHVLEDIEEIVREEGIIDRTLPH